MLSTHLLALMLALAPSLASAGLFPPDSVVKMLDPKSFKKAMRANQTSMVAFVAPWCGHCQRMVPEYTKAAIGMYPLVPAYGVDCDDEKNKRLCAEQGVKGFPTVKLFPKGKYVPPMTYDSGERTSSAFFYWATRRIPNAVTKLYKVEDVAPWVEKTATSDKPRALLLTKDKKVPLLWKVLGNKYQGQLEFATHRDRKGKSSVILGYEAGEKKAAKVFIYPVGSKQAVRYEGINKLDSLTKFFDSVLDGTADLNIINEQAAAEEFIPDPKDLEIEAQQEAQRIALAHGGFADLIDFEEAVKNGAGADYHDTHGYPGMMGGAPPPKKEKPSQGEKAPKTRETPGVKPMGQAVEDMLAEKAQAKAEAQAGEEQRKTEEKAEKVVESEKAAKEAEEDDSVVSEAPEQVVFEALKDGASASPPLAGECTAPPSEGAAGECGAPSERPKDEL